MLNLISFKKITKNLVDLIDPLIYSRNMFDAVLSLMQNSAVHFCNAIPDRFSGSWTNQLLRITIKIFGLQTLAEDF